MGLRLLFYLLLGFRYGFRGQGFRISGLGFLVRGQGFNLDLHGPMGCGGLASPSCLCLMVCNLGLIRSYSKQETGTMWNIL